jgi:hypothetical protein
MHTKSSVCLVLTSCLVGGCMEMPDRDGMGVLADPGRPVRTADIRVPEGYTIEALATGLTFPTGVTTDDAGRVYVTEAGYSYGEVWGQARLLRVDEDGATTIIATGGHPPWNGVDYADHAFFIAEGGEVGGGRIVRVEPGPAGARQVILADNLPSFGDHHTNGPLVRGGYVYFGQGTATNSGVVGLDNLQMGWLEGRPDFHDIPAKDITLAGVNLPAGNLRDPLSHEPVLTGAFCAFGDTTTPGEVIKGRLPCTGAIMRVPVSGGPIELVAWGLRNPAGLAFTGDGRLYATDTGAEARGSRPIAGGADVVWGIAYGAWYGWPDYQGGEPVTTTPAKAARLLAHHPATPPRPMAKLGSHAGIHGMDIARGSTFGFAGEAFVAEVGDMAPAVGRVLSPAGFRVVRVDVRTGSVRDFAVNTGGSVDGQSAPASRLGTAGLERPIAVRFSRDGRTLYIVDFGVINVTKDGVEPTPGTGVLWRVTRTDAGPRLPARR